MKRLLIPLLLLLSIITSGQKNYYIRNDGTPLMTEEKVRLEYKQSLILKKAMPDYNPKPYIFHKEYRKDSIINYFYFGSADKDTVPLKEFKFTFHQDPIFLYLNKKMPSFILKDTKGMVFKSSQLLGKPTLVNYSGTYCKACLTEIPNLNKLKSIYGDKVNFISIADVERKPGGLKTYLDLYKNFQYRILENTVENKQALNMPTIPRNIFLDKNGVIRNIQKVCNYDNSDPKSNYFMKIIDDLIKEK